MRLSRHAAPYLDRPDYRGIPNLEADKFKRLVTALDQEKFQVHIHAIGDRAIRMALDAHEAAQLANGRRDARHHLAHIQLIDPQDIPRFERLGIIANFQSL
ncbi:MAG: amidohydrolase, partial [Anaerolineae bacterium]|nr:amidohydrolase [Anaerolineae bacterium]